MKDFVSSATICVAVLAAISITWSVLVGVYGRPATGPWSVGLMGLLALTVAQWVGFRATRAIAQVRDVDTEPRLATVPVRMGGSEAAVSVRGARAL
jgi:hypothetical protein